MLLKNFVDEKTCAKLAKYMDENRDQHVVKDPVEKAIAFNKVFSEFHYRLTEKLEKIVNKTLFPTKDYSRIYLKGSELLPHTDRPHCEYSITLNLKNAPEGNSWPFYIKKPGEWKKETFNLDVGDAIVYDGIHWMHWRNTLEYDMCYQVFLHWVDANGSHSDIGVKNYKEFI